MPARWPNVAKTAEDRLLEEKVVVEYLRDFSQRRVAATLGLDKSKVFRILHDPEVRARIDEDLIKADVTVDRVRAEFKKLAFYSPRDFFDEDGKLLPLAEIDENAAMAINSIEVTEIFDGVGKDRIHVGNTKKIKLADKGQNLERLGRYLKMFTDKIEHSGKIDGEKVDEELKSLLQELRQRKNDPAA